jgi:hypothetical protein
MRLRRRTRSLRDLRKLVRVTQEHDALRSRPDGDRVGKRHLPGFIDEERVDVLIELRARESQADQRATPLTGQRPRRRARSWRRH